MMILKQPPRLAMRRPPRGTHHLRHQTNQLIADRFHTHPLLQARLLGSSHILKRCGFSAGSVFGDPVASWFS
ncbi:MAG: hypothetical protein FWD59_05360 [Micrococcales bacterium]|nr:hypothetical protein [Micrococcales bacterium]